MEMLFSLENQTSISFIIFRKFSVLFHSKCKSSFIKIHLSSGINSLMFLLQKHLKLDTQKNCLRKRLP